MMTPKKFNHAWLGLLRQVIHGQLVAPRGQPTMEIPQSTIVVDMRRPVLTLETRKLNYRFMTAEAFWILTGDDRLSELARFNPRMAEFSDDGVTLRGAYGPRIQDQLPYVLDKLQEDRDTRQAGLTIWQPNPAASKDIPCTVALWFQLRAGKLNVHAFMRSNDVWLGTPYDVFSFSMLAWYVCAELRLRLANEQLEPGALYLTAASHHLYLEHFKAVADVLAHAEAAVDHEPMVPAELLARPGVLLHRLEQLRHTKKGDPLRWWEPKEER